MKNCLITTILLIAVANAALASGDHEGGITEGSGVLFKNGQGLSFTETMLQAIDLKTAEVTEESMTPVIFTELQSYKKGKELSGWIKADEAKHIKKGAIAALDSGNKNFQGKVIQVKRSSYAAGGDYEITVLANENVIPGAVVTATFAVPVNEAALVIPRSSLLTTAEGKFVYAKSGDFYVRTPVKTGNISNDKIEILDGLYSGDEVVTTPVMQLWLAELQAIRGGQSCADGH